MGTGIDRTPWGSTCEAMSRQDAGLTPHCGVIQDLALYVFCFFDRKTAVFSRREKRIGEPKVLQIPFIFKTKTKEEHDVHGDGN